MSHITTIKAKITDEECLRLAAGSMGLEVREKGTFYNYGRNTRCDFCVGAKGHDSEVGIVRREDGTLDIRMDNYDSIRDKVGRNASELIQRYSVEVTKKAALAKGWRVREEKLDNGSIKLVATAGATAKAGGKRW